MTLENLLCRLDGVRLRGSRYEALCPAHQDRTPSLSLSEGGRGLLLKCWAGCTLQAICAALNLRVSDLFFDAPNSHAASPERVRRKWERHRKAQRAEVDGFILDALREADAFIRSRRGLDLAAWNHQRLNDELDVLADAYTLLLAEEGTQWT